MMSTSRLQSYSIQIETMPTYGYNSNCLTETIYAVYDILSRDDVPIHQIKICSLYNTIKLTTFNLAYCNGLILYNEIDTIRASSLYPEGRILDSVIEKKLSVGFTPIANKKFDPIIFGNKITTQPVPYRKPNICTVPQQSRKPIPSASDPVMYGNKFNELFAANDNQSGIIYNTEESQSDSDSEELAPPLEKNRPHDEEFETKREINRLNRIESTRSAEKMKIFIDDKKTFQRIKSDIDSGKLHPDRIHPIFAAKYEVFELLDSREAIDFTTNDNLDAEYQIFNEYMEYCLEESDDDMMNTPKKQDDIYIPHNYSYMSTDDKQKYLKKIKMTQEDFETEYAGKINI